MNFSFFVHESAIIDLANAANWYEEQRAGLKELFFAEWERVQKHIENAPFANVKFKRHFRQCRMMRFPYVILYEIEGQKIIIYSVIHTSRNPKLRLRHRKKQ